MSFTANPYLELFNELVLADRALIESVRKKLIWAYSWAVPSREAIAELVLRQPLVEIGSGTGYWAWLVAQAGGRIIAYDREPLQPPKWIEVIEGEASRVRDHADATLFLCWPPYKDPMAADALAHYHGDTVIYVGEFRGRTADDLFHTRLEADWILERELKIPSWPGFRDALHVFRRKESIFKPA